MQRRLRVEGNRLMTGPQWYHAPMSRLLSRDTTTAPRVGSNQAAALSGQL
jgi:hypothetical protein